MDGIERLINLFRLLPGVGPRQARRFVYFLLRQENGLSVSLAAELQKLKTIAGECAECGRFFSSSAVGGAKNVCAWCADESREPGLLMVVEKEADLDSVRQAGVYQGKFFVLGALLSPLRSGLEAALAPRLRRLRERVARDGKRGPVELILALAASPDGDHTAEFLKNFLEKELGPDQIKISTLGRGLSTGSELEYSDSETLKQAILHRESSKPQTDKK